MKISVKVDNKSFIFTFKNVKSVDNGYPMGATIYYTPVIIDESTSKEVVVLEETSFYGCGNWFWSVLRAWYSKMFMALLDYLYVNNHNENLVKPNIQGEVLEIISEDYYNPKGGE